jgi:hypothetical protein
MLKYGICQHVQNTYNFLVQNQTVLDLMFSFDFICWTFGCLDLLLFAPFCLAKKLVLYDKVKGV